MINVPLSRILWGTGQHALNAVGVHVLLRSSARSALKLSQRELHAAGAVDTLCMFTHLIQLLHATQ